MSQIHCVPPEANQLNEKYEVIRQALAAIGADAATLAHAWLNVIRDDELVKLRSGAIQFSWDDSKNSVVLVIPLDSDSMLGPGSPTTQ